MSYKEYAVRVHDNGDELWYNKDKQLHRENGPAFFYKECKCWIQNGHYHREDGLAIEHSNGKNWAYRGKRFKSRKEYDAYIASLKPPSCENKLVEIDGVKYKLTKV